MIVKIANSSRRILSAGFCCYYLTQGQCRDLAASVYVVSSDRQKLAEIGIFEHTEDVNFEFDIGNMVKISIKDMFPCNIPSITSEIATKAVVEGCYICWYQVIESRGSMDTIRRVRAVCFFLEFACLCKSGNSTPNVEVIYTICNGATFSLRESSYVKCMNNVLDLAKNGVADHGYSFYATVHDETSDFRCWAHAACNGEISKLDCFACVTRAHDLLIKQCERNIGAQFQLKDCRVRREKYEFKDD